jgi:hypothetical protein
MTRTLVMAGLIGMAVLGAGAAHGQDAAAGGARTPVEGPRLGPVELPVGVPTAPRADGSYLPFPGSLLRTEPQFGIDPRMAILPAGVLVLMAVLGLFTFRAASRV